MMKTHPNGKLRWYFEKKCDLFSERSCLLPEIFLYHVTNLLNHVERNVRFERASGNFFSVAQSQMLVASSDQAPLEHRLVNQSNSCYKSQNQVEGRRALNVCMKTISVLNPCKSWKKIPKAGGKLEEIFKMYDSVRKELQDEEFIILSWKWMSLSLIALDVNVTWTCPIWQPKNMDEKFNRSSCFVKFCWLGIIA